MFPFILDYFSFLDFEILLSKVLNFVLFVFFLQHGTCPICRKTLNENETSEETNNASGSVNSVLSPLATLFRLVKLVFMSLLENLFNSIFSTDSIVLDDILIN